MIAKPQMISKPTTCPAQVCILSITVTTTVTVANTIITSINTITITTNRVHIEHISVINAYAL
jgi:hypothetical protein